MAGCRGITRVILFLLITAHNIVFLLGSSSLSMIPYSVYYVDVERLVREVLDLKASSDDANNTSPAPGYSLGPDQLPTKWAFGMSGRCDYFTLTSPSDSSTSPEPEPLYCQREFLPSQDMATVIEDALRNGFNKALPVPDDPEYVINKVLDVLRWILDLPSLRHIPQQALKARMWMRSSAGLTIASVISDFLGPGITISKELSHGRLFLIFLIPTVLSAAAVACVVQTARTGMGGLWEVNKVGFAWFAPAVGAGVYGVVCLGICVDGMGWFRKEKKEEILVPVVDGPVERVSCSISIRERRHIFW